MKVFLDANVLFSASNPTSNIAALVRLVVKREQAVTSDLAAEEARRNLHQKRPAWEKNLAPLLVGIQLVPSVIFPLSVLIGDKDKPILCAAIREKCTHLATGDKRDFKHLFDQTVEGVMVVSLLRLAEIIAGRHDE